MTTAYTSLLGLALPVTGELSGTWGDTVNNSITSLLDSAVAGTTTLSTDADVTLTTTTGSSNQARQAILLCSGARTALRTITAPAQSKIYTVINATTGGYSVKVVGSGPTTGLTIPNGSSAVIAWNGSDFIEIGSSTIGNLTVNGNLTVTGNTTLGDASTDTATINAAATLNANAVISVTDNTNAALRITQLGTGNALLVEDSTSTDSTPFVIDASGKVVVGYTSAPTISGVPQLQLANSATQAGSQLGVSNWITGSTSGAGIQLAKSRSGTVGTQGIVSSGDTIGQIQFFGDDGTAFISAASITASVDGTPGTNDMPGRLVFSTTADGASSPTERMRIDSSGNVGIGTSSPAVKLDVSGTMRSTSATITGAAGGTITPTSDATNQYTITALGAAATIAIPSGTPIDGQKLTIRIKDNGTARALTWTTSAGGYRIIGTTLPVTTVISKTVYIGCVYNSADSFWDVVAVAQQA